MRIHINKSQLCKSSRHPSPCLGRDRRPLESNSPSNRLPPEAGAPRKSETTPRSLRSQPPNQDQLQHFQPTASLISSCTPRTRPCISVSSTARLSLPFLDPEIGLRLGSKYFGTLSYNFHATPFQSNHISATPLLMILPFLTTLLESQNI
jgi:hypothetical protein